MIGKYFPTYKQACYFVHALFKYRAYFLRLWLCYFVLSLYHFECTTTFDRRLFWEVCPMHSVSVIMHVLAGNLAFYFFYTVTAVLFIVFCHLYFSISFVATLSLFGYIYLERPLPSTK